MRNSKGFKAATKGLQKAVERQLRQDIAGLRSGSSGSVMRNGADIGIDTGNWTVGNVTFTVNEYTVNWQNSGGNLGFNKITYSLERTLTFSDEYNFVFDQSRPGVTFFTDTLPRVNAGPGTPFTISGSISQRVEGKFTIEPWKR